MGLGADGVDGEGEGVAQAESPNLAPSPRRGYERVIRGYDIWIAGGVDPQQLAQQIAQILGIRGRVGITDADVKHSIEAEVDRAAVVIPGCRGYLQDLQLARRVPR